jgi:hypothetical protein
MTVSLKHNKLLWAAIIIGLAFGNILAVYYHPKEVIIDPLDGNVRSHNLQYNLETITYKTIRDSGPVFSTLQKGCFNYGEFGLGSGYRCLILRYDGGPGVVELKIPSDLIKDFQWVRTIEASGVPIPFQRIIQDSQYSTFRVDVPTATKYHNEIRLMRGDGGHIPLWLDYLGNAAMFSGIGIILAFFLFIPSYYVFEYVKRKFRG